MRVLITGLAGHVGSILAEQYLEAGHEVHGTVRERSDLSFIKHNMDKYDLHLLDIRDANAVQRIVRGDGHSYDVIHHLAGLTFVPTSWQIPSEVFQTNTIGTLNFLEALRNETSSTIFHFAGTSEEYGRVPQDKIPIREETRLDPSSPYAISKVAAEQLCSLYTEAYGVKTIITRAFNHSSARRGGQFVTKAVCKQTAEIELNMRKEFELGDTSVKRDWLHASDVCRAYRLAVQKCVSGWPYNICSGEAHSILELIETACEIADIDPIPTIVTHPSKLRRIDNPILLGDNSRFLAATGWKPKISFRDLIKEIYEHELEALSK